MNFVVNYAWDEEYTADEMDNEHDLEDFEHVLLNNDRVFEEQIDEIQEINELKVWAVKSRCPRKHLDALLKILKRRLTSEIPICSSTFLHTSGAKYKVTEMLDAD